MGQISPSFMTFKVCRLYLGVLGQPESKWKLFEKIFTSGKNRTSTEISLYTDIIFTSPKCFKSCGKLAGREFHFYL